MHNTSNNNNNLFLAKDNNNYNANRIINTVCKYYVNGNCTNENCRFWHIDNICRNNFYNECTKPNCRYNHNYKFGEKINVRTNNYTSTINKSNNYNNNFTKIKNTETFEPSHKEPSIRIRFNEPIKYGNEVSITNNIFYDNSLFQKLTNEISNDVYIPWHGDSHLIANDNFFDNWKDKSETFNYIIKLLCGYFCMTPGATRLNYYSDSIDWKPYHHDAAALKPDKAKTQNITVGVSLGLTREISFESTHENKNERVTINIPLKDSTVYAFGNQVNIDFRHGIPQLKDNNSKARISIIIWGYSSLLN